MVNTKALHGLVVASGLTLTDLAKMIDVAPATLYRKMKKGVFGSDEIQKMIDGLDIKDPMAIFFANEVTSKDTDKRGCA